MTPSLFSSLASTGFGAAAEIAAAAFAQAPTRFSQPKDNYVVEGAVTVILFGVALFAVCRSSRRN